jgi:PAS domain S-box-containing protein
MASKLKQKTELDLDTLNLLPLAVVLFDDKKIYFLNRIAAKLFQASVNQISSIEKHTLINFIDKKQTTTLKKACLLASKQQQANFELTVTNFKKKTFFTEIKLTRVHYKNKEVFQAVFTEITQQHNIKNELEVAKNLLQEINANAIDVIFNLSFEPNTHLKFISDSCKKLLGFYPHEIYKNPQILKTQLHSEDQKFIITSKKEYLKLSNKSVNKKALIRFINKRGQTKYIEIEVNPILQNKEITGIVGTMRDATERAETEKLLMETKEKFDLITNNGNDVIAFYTFLPEEKYLYVSPNITKLLGYHPNELLEDNEFFSKRVIGSKDYSIKTDQELLKHQKNNIVKNSFYTFRILKKSNQEIWLESNFFPIADSKGKVRFFLNILRDITEQKEKEIEIQNQYTNYRNLLDGSPVAYMIHQHGVCLYCNNALVKLLKLKNKNQILGKFTIDIFDAADRKKALERINDAYNRKNTNKFYNYNLRDNRGNAIEVEIKSLLINFNNVECVLTLINNLSDRRQIEREKLKVEITESTNKLLQKEIKERKEVEKNLVEKTAHLSSIFENSSHLIWTVNRKYELTTFNKNFYDVVKLQHNVGITIGCRIDRLLLINRREYINFWYPKYAETFLGKKLEFEKEDFNTHKVYRKVFLNPIFNEKNEVTEINCIAHDVTESKTYEQKLLNQTGKLSAIFDSSHHYIWTISKDEKLTSFNKNYFDLITSLYNTKPYLGLVLNRGVLSNDKEYTTLLNYHYRKAFDGIATNFEIETLDKEQKKIYLEIFLNPIYENDKVIEVSGIAHNITEKKFVQQRMEQSLKEKEVLLKEVHHRVKNNMQVVSSILNLQSSYVSDEYALTLLKESQNRIKTMAYIHESLYQNKSFTSVNFSEYVSTLVNNIIQSYTYSKQKIKLVLNIEKVTLSLDTSIPAGLIINELVTNAIKHAFPDSKRGIIYLNLKSENNFVFLELKDNGVGFADNVDFENSHSLGLQLVNTLIEQIEGKFNFKSEKNVGTEVLVTFKM